MVEQEKLLRFPRLPIPPPLMMSEKGSFAHFTVTQRMPGIVRRVIAENDFSPTIVENLENLIRELPNGIARFLQDDPAPDLTRNDEAQASLVISDSSGVSFVQ